MKTTHIIGMIFGCGILFYMIFKYLSRWDKGNLFILGVCFIGLGFIGLMYWLMKREYMENNG